MFCLMETLSPFGFYCHFSWNLFPRLRADFGLKFQRRIFCVKYFPFAKYKCSEIKASMITRDAFMRTNFRCPGETGKWNLINYKLLWNSCNCRMFCIPQNTIDAYKSEKEYLMHVSEVEIRGSLTHDENRPTTRGFLCPRQAVNY